MNDERVIYYGGTVKALGDGRVGGYLVRYGAPDVTDLEGDFFTKATDFDIEDGAQSAVYYHHGLDVKVGARRIGTGHMKLDDIGVWIEAQLNMRDEYEKAIYEMASRGKLGWSSGTAPHLVEREPIGKAYHIKKWPLGLDASLTPTPAEPRNAATPLKTLINTDDHTAQTDKGATGAGSVDSVNNRDGLVSVSIKTDGTIDITRGDSMSDKPKNAPVARKELTPEEEQQVAEIVANMPENATDADVEAIVEEVMPEDITDIVRRIVAEELSAMNMTDMEEDKDAPVLKSEQRPDIAEKVRKAMERRKAQLTGPNGGELPRVTEAKMNGVPNIKRVTNRGFGDNEIKAAFDRYLRTGDKTAYNSIKTNVAPINSSTTGEGAENVPDDFYGQVVAKRDERSVARTAGARVIRTSSDLVRISTEGTSLSVFNIVAEEGAIADAEDEPGFTAKDVTVYEFSKLIKVTNRQLEDEQVDLYGFLMDAVGRAMAATENKYVLTGTGTGQPQGVLVGGTKAEDFAQTAIAKEEIPAIYYDLKPEYSDDAVWVMSHVTEGYLMSLADADNWNFVTPVAAGNPYGKTLWNRPVYNSAQMPAIGSGLKSVVYGNFFYYGLVERLGLTVQRLNELYAGNGYVGFLFRFRMGGAVLQSEAFQYGQHATA